MRLPVSPKLSTLLFGTGSFTLLAWLLSLTRDWKIPSSLDQPICLVDLQMAGGDSALALVFVGLVFGGACWAKYAEEEKKPAGGARPGTSPSRNAQASTVRRTVQ